MLIRKWWFIIFLIFIVTLVVAWSTNGSKYDHQDEFIQGYAVVSKDGKFGLINQKGEEVVPVEYQSASYFVGEYAKVKKDGKFGFVDKSGKIAVAPRYDKIYGFNGEYAKVILDGKFGMLNKAAQEVLAPEYDAVNYNIIGGYFEVATKGEVNKIQKDQVMANLN